MRVGVLMMAGWFLAGCGGPGGEASTDAKAEKQQPSAAANEAVSPAVQPEVAEAPVSPCLVQGAERLQVAPIRAVGTEPFWGARVEGRCVTYSTPENQQGVRVWARYTEAAAGRATWAGQLDGKPFEMRVSPEPGCSDGMSDERYPLAVELTVHGEQRRGCAEPI